MEICTCEKAVFFLPVNILMMWCAGFLGHTTVCLDFNNNFLYIVKIYYHQTILQDATFDFTTMFNPGFLKTAPFYTAGLFLHGFPFFLYF